MKKKLVTMLLASCILTSSFSLTVYADAIEFETEIIYDDIDIPVVSGYSQTHSIKEEKLQKAVADYYGITVEALKGKKKSKNIAYPRMLGMYMARIMTNESFPRIGLEFGGRDHSTVIHACDKIEEDLKNKLMGLADKNSSQNNI